MSEIFNDECPNCMSTDIDPITTGTEDIVNWECHKCKVRFRVETIRKIL